jgi:hypothetical protein
MFSKNPILLFIFCFAIYGEAKSQAVTLQQGLFYKAGTNIRLGSVQILNRRSHTTVKSNTIGVFSITASTGDTLSISSPGFMATDFVVTDLADKVFFLEQGTDLPEVVIKENSIQADLNEVKRGYRKKSVFYTGTPHYYYLFLKPMTFIYENFKGEVRNARKFNRYAKDEVAYYEIAARFNDQTIKSAIVIEAGDLEEFKSTYWPSLQQVRSWNDYDLAGYIKRSYQIFIENKGISKSESKSG